MNLDTRSFLSGRSMTGVSRLGKGAESELTPSGEVYSGVNAENASNILNLSWASFLTDAEHVGIEDAKVPLQAYPWHDLDSGAWSAGFIPASKRAGYTSGMVRLSLSSIPESSHVVVTLNGVPLQMYWDDGSHDRRWVEVSLPFGLAEGEWNATVALTEEGKAAEPGQGGKMVSSFEVIEYGDDFEGGDKVSAYPTYDVRGAMTLRPTNEACLMRAVTYPRKWRGGTGRLGRSLTLASEFCPVCAHGLREALIKRRDEKKYA